MPFDMNRTFAKNRTSDNSVIQEGDKGFSPTAKTLVRSLLGLPEKGNSRARCHVSVPPVGFRYGPRSLAEEGGEPFVYAGGRENSYLNKTGGLIDVSAERIGSLNDEVAPLEREGRKEGRAYTHSRKMSGQPGAEQVVQAPHANDSPQTERGVSEAFQSPGRKIATAVTELSPAAEDRAVFEPDNNKGSSRQRTKKQVRKKEIDIPGFPKRKQAASSMAVKNGGSISLKSESSNGRKNLPGESAWSHERGQADHLHASLKDASSREKLSLSKGATTSQGEKRGSADDRMTAVTISGMDTDRKMSSVGQKKTADADFVSMQKENVRPAFQTMAETDVSGADQVDQLRRSFHELMTKKMADGKKERNQSQTVTEKEPGPPPVQQVIIMQRPVLGSKHDRPAAFWERSCSGFSHLKMIR